MKKPFFSIVLPTHDRAHYLGYAIQSGLNQTFEDFEFIISNNFSSDNTKEVAHSFNDKRIRYVETDKLLSVDESAEFAINQARGEYVTFLSDDDAASLIFLETFYNIIKEHQTRLASCISTQYYHDNSKDYGKEIKQDSVLIAPFTNQMFVYDSAKVIKHIFAQVGLTNAPTMKNIGVPLQINAVYHNSLVSQVQSQVGNFFSTPGIDMYSAIMTLNLVDQHYYLDAPLSLHGLFAKRASVAEDIETKEKKEAHRLLMLSGGFDHVPLRNVPGYNNLNAYIRLQAKADLGESLDYIELDYTRYFLMCFDELVHLRANGEVTNEDFEEFFRVLSQQDKVFQDKVLSVINNPRTKAKNWMTENFKNSRGFGWFRRNVRYKEYKILEGRKEGFSNIAECANMIDKTFLDKYSKTI